MHLNITKLSLDSFLIIFLAVSCTENKKYKSETIKIQPKKIIDDCVTLDLAKGNNLEFNVGCSGCHTAHEKRNLLNVPSFPELSRIDSLKLSDFIFLSKHNGYFKKEPTLNFRIKKIDSLSECDRKNLIHFIKQYNRPHVYITNTP
ncbi:hypothetical protein [Pedobacter miscanthi]|uniref:hypothetical protein n=1 Tax=Pedobacter miscanthi TaxID=2259170 RepID=UPI0029306C22|nr:hypothetical protein [Pedobacter miscanthi]